jgi:very-short-patch-repair endonuclease
MSPNKSQGEDELARQLDALGIAYEREWRFAPPRRWKVDFRLMAGEWGVEVEGGQWSGGHKRGTAADSDTEKSNAALLSGFKILRFTPGQVQRGEALQTIEAALGRG